MGEQEYCLRSVVGRVVGGFRGAGCPAVQPMVSTSSMNSGQSHSRPQSPDRSSKPQPATTIAVATTAAIQLDVDGIRAGSTVNGVGNPQGLANHAHQLM